MPKPDAKKSPDDLVSWLQYPIEDSFEKTYCSPSFEDQPWPIHHPSETSPHIPTRTVLSPENPLKAHAVRSKGSSFHSNLTRPIQGGHGLHRSSSEIAEGAMALGAQRAEKSMSFSSLGGGRTKLRKSISELSHQFDSSNIQLSGSSLITNDTRPTATSSEYNTSGEYLCASASTSTSAPTNGSMISSSSFKVCHGEQKSFRMGSGSQAASLATADVISNVEICKEKLHVTATPTDGSESQSEDADDECVEIKRPRRTSSKRNRAAEVHNLSERNRRNRINEKLKALQDLIPNSTKTDKASVLDEAIEYMKSLQMQLQMVSMRNSGMNVSPVIVPVGFPHMQMAPHPTMGLGLPIGHPGMGIGMYSPGIIGGPYQTTIPGMSPYGIPYQDGCIVQNQPYNNGHAVQSQPYSDGCNAQGQSYQDVESQPYNDQCSVESQVFEKVEFPQDDA